MSIRSIPVTTCLAMTLVMGLLQPTAAKAQFQLNISPFGSSSQHNRDDSPGQRGPYQDLGGINRSPSNDDHPPKRSPVNFDLFFNPRVIGPGSSRPRRLSEREQLEAQLKTASPEEFVPLYEAWQSKQFGQQLNLQFVGAVPSAAQVAGALRRFPQKRAGVVYIVALEDELQLVVLPPASQSFVQRSAPLIASAGPSTGLLAQTSRPKVIRKVQGKVDRDRLLKVAQEFRRQVSDPTQIFTQSYLESAQQLYGWLIAPIEAELRAHHIDTLLFSMDGGLRTIPMAALHDGQQFLVEKYEVALIPSFGLTDARPSNLKNRTLLAMGISEETQGLSSLPAVPVELSVLTHHFWQGQSQATINEDTTLTNLKAFNRQQRHGIIHLATHAEFKPGQVDNSFIQFWNRRLTLDQLRPLSQELQWGAFPSVELLVLSACKTALNSKEAELGFAGSAIAAGVPATMASLWNVSDEGTLGLMTNFYQHLRRGPTKTEAIRQAQLAMLRGEVKIGAGHLHLSENVQVDLPDALAKRGDRMFNHPYFWSGYTVIGNWH